jgi:sulfotransferase family protein
VIKRLIGGAKRVLGLHRPGRNLIVLPDDVFLVSYPKSGNTWTRFLIANLIHEAPVTFANIDRLIPESEELSKRRLQRLPKPRIMKSHEYFDPRYPRVIYLVRDPRDVVVSEYHYFRKRRRIANDLPLETFVSRFLAGQTSDYGSWAENVGSWVAARHNHPGFLLLRYEDMLADTCGAVTTIALFLGQQPTPERVGHAVERSCAERMRELESDPAANSSVTRDGRQDIPFVREARAGMWTSILSRESATEIERACGPLMRYLGYEPLYAQSTDICDPADFVLSKPGSSLPRGRTRS